MSTIKVDTISDEAGTGAPNFPNGIGVTGTVTATSFAGDGSALTSLTSANLTGNLPAINGAALTSLTSANLTGALPAIDGSALTGIATTPTSAQVGTATAGLATGAVGTYAFARVNQAINITPSGSVAGSGLRFAGASTGQSNSATTILTGTNPTSPTLAGTWRSMSGHTVRSSSYYALGLFVRIS